MPALAHAKLGPSGAHRWMVCPASVAMEAEMPEGKSDSPHIIEGNTAHALAEMALANEQNADAYLGTRFNDDLIHVDQDMVEYVQEYLDYVRGLGGKLLVEQRVDLTRWVPEGFGTADAVVFHEGILFVVDLKYGKGVPVNAERNPQAMCYALGALNEYDFLFDIQTVCLVVHQPRLDSVSEWEISRDDLLAWGDDDLKPAAELALSEDAPFNPGEKQCRWCAAKPVCRALAEYNLGLACVNFSTVGDPVDLVKPNSLSNAAIGGLLPELDGLVKWARAVQAYAKTEMEQGHDIPDHKLVEGRANRKWADEEAAGKALARKLTTKDAYVRKVITITQAEKLLGKKDPLIAKHTIKPKGEPVVAHISDARPAISQNIETDFDQVA